MNRISGLRLLPFLSGLCLMLLLWLAAEFLAPQVFAGLQSRFEDAAMQLARPFSARAPDRPRIVIVDIDRRTLDAYGPWPWRRSRFAALVARVAEAEPAVIATDILFSQADTRSPAAIARNLASVTGRADLKALSATLDDDDPALAAALALRPTILGFAFRAQDGGPVPPAAPILVRGEGGLPGIWASPGAEMPVPTLAEAAAGFGAAVLPGDPDGIVRQMSALVAVGDSVLPGLALETVRLFLKQGAYKANLTTRQLIVGNVRLPLAEDAMLRLAPDSLGDAVDTRSAMDLLEGGSTNLDLKDAIVLIGSSAPELGGLRASATSSLTPGVRLQAGMMRQMLDGYLPDRWPTSRPAIAVISLLAGALAALAAAFASPLKGAGALLALVALSLFAVLLAAASGVLVVYAEPAALVLAAYVASATVAYSLQARRERRVRRHFEQRLAPHLVSVIANNPALLKLKGERRVVTSLFTDIEGFTGLTSRAEPEDLVALLDAYFEGITDIIADHGGMIDKFVGDAVHAFFNAPLDLPDHAETAVRAAIAVAAWSNAFCKTPAAARLALGRTRIGIETGAVVVGDVGVKNRLDYTAYGDAVNAAARLEAANKELGSQICIGPGTASLCPDGMLKPNGRLHMRGFASAIETYTPV